MPRTQKGSNRSSNQGPGKAKGNKQPKKQHQGGAAVQVAPAAIGNKRGSSKPKEVRNQRGERCLVFEEYVKDISGSVAFTAEQIPVQPGLSAMFAWLSTQAPSYQEYRFKKLKFRFETEKSSATSGKIMLAFNPDAADSVPESKLEVLENEHKSKCAVWQDTVLSVPTRINDALGKTRFVRSAVLAANLDIKTYDMGNLIVATNGCVDASLIGELYVDYEIELLTPVFDVSDIAAATSKTFVGVSPSDTSLMGVTPTATGGLDATGTGNTVTFNRVGRYIVALNVVGTGLFTSFVPVTSTSTATQITQLVGISNAGANAGTQAVANYQVIIRERGQTLVLDCDTQATTLTASALRIASFSN